MKHQQEHLEQLRLFTAVVRCHFCLTELSRTLAVEKKPGTKIHFNQCPLHPTAGFVVEWEPKS